MSYRLLLCLLVLAAACRPDISFTPTARVEGDSVVIEAQCGDRIHIAVGDQYGNCDKTSPVAIRFPAARLGAGKHSIKVTGSIGEVNSKTKTITVEIPESALGPYFTVGDCVDEPDGKGVALTVSTSGGAPATAPAAAAPAASGGNTLECRTASGPRVKITGKANAKAKLTIGGKTTEVPESGEFEAVVELTEGLLALSIDDFVSDASDGPNLVVPWKLDAGGKVLEGTMTLAGKYGDHDDLVQQWLREIIDGKIARPAFTPRAEGRQTIILLRKATGYRAQMAATDRRGTVREIGMIAFDRETKSTRGETCTYIGSSTVKATRIEAETEVTVTSASDGKVVATKLFPPPSDCPSSAQIDDKEPEVHVVAYVEDITKWLDTLAEPAAPADAAGAIAPAAPQ